MLHRWNADPTGPGASPGARGGSGPKRFLASAILAMAVVTALGLLVQRWMTYELLSVDGGAWEWGLAAAVLIVLGLGTALLVGLPCSWIAGALVPTGPARAVVFVCLAAAVTAVLYRSLVPFATTALDHALIPALALVFFGVLHAGAPGGPRGERSPPPIRGPARGAVAD